MKVTRQGNVTVNGCEKLYSSDTVILLAIHNREKYSSLFAEGYEPDGIELYLQTEEDSKKDYDRLKITVVLLDDICPKDWIVWGNRTIKHTIHITLANKRLFQHEKQSV